jgi:PAN domain
VKASLIPLFKATHPPPTVFSPRPLDLNWTKVLKDSENYWTFYVHTDHGLLVVTDSKPYTMMTVDPSRPAVEAVISSAESARAGKGGLPTLEPDTNRPGQDYKSFELTDANPELCQKACADDPRCKAFTYVKPGGQGPRAMCWLKSSIPAASKSDCCVSGAKRATPSSAARPARP